MPLATTAVAAVLPIHFFKGPIDTPFLAPRGVCLAAGKLFVSDTGRNRVFIWHKIPTAEGANPDVVLGQLDTDGTGRNAGGAVSAHTLQYPSGIWSDGQKLVVADAWNHRVLIWHQLPTTDGQPADVVLGQPNFEQNKPNVTGIGAAPSARSLYWPYGVWSDGKHLWVADTGNRRVLFFEQIPTTHQAAATAVIGKPSFDTRDYEPADAVWPYAVKIGPHGQLAITDTQYYRVLLWAHWQDALSKPADLMLGQPDLASNGQNQYGLFPQAHTLSWCYDSCFWAEGLLVADTGNSRILRFDQWPIHNAPAADGIFGKPNFTTGSENADTLFGTDKSLYWPFAISAYENTLAVADTGNHRIVFYPL